MGRTAGRSTKPAKRGAERFAVLYATVMVLLLSVAAAAGLTWLLRPKAAPGAASSLFSRSLARPYRLLNDLRWVPIPGQPLSAEDAGLGSPGLRRLADVRTAAERLKQGDAESALALLGAETGADDGGFVAERERHVRLACLFRLNRVPEFLALFDRRPPAAAELRMQRIVCLLRSGRGPEAGREFRALFRRSRLAGWREQVDDATLERLLAGLDDADFWQDKFNWLLASRDGAEFAAEARYAARFPQLVTLYRGEFAYLGKEWRRMAALLRAVKEKRYRLRCDVLLFKARLRQEGVAAFDAGPELDRFRADPPLYRELLFDVASLLLAKGADGRALPLLARFRELAPANDEFYWRSLWTSAWIHYRQRAPELALPFFQLGCRSPFPAYRIASLYWRERLEEAPATELERYPFSYYTVRRIGDPMRYRGMIGRFCRLIAMPAETGLAGHWHLLRGMLANGWIDEARAAIVWAMRDRTLTAADRRLLQLAESLVLWRSGDFQRAFLRLRENLGTIEELRLPDFLSGIALPVMYQDLVVRHSRRAGVDPWLVMALIREESFFRYDARSSANAYGLMQLLPATAFDIARVQEFPFRRPDLLHPETNIRLGTIHLRTVLDRYGGRVPLALAAYNAGESRVDEWLRQFPSCADDEFIEMIPFTETRNYVKNILRNQFFYRYYHEKG